MVTDILLIDDETDYSETMGFWLMANGYKVSIASSGMEGLESIEKSKPDIVFLDMQMPGMDGIETLKKIKERWPDLPVIMVTAYTTDEKRMNAMRIGADAFFGKGDDFSLAAKTMREVLNRVRDSKNR